jgi:nucleoid DNA-binding protein
MTRADLRRALQEKGFTYREADKILSAMIASWVDALRNGQKLELPIGDITLVRVRPYRDYKLGKIVTYRRPRFIFKEKTDV